MALQSFFVQGRFLGSREVSNFLRQEGGAFRPTCSWVYFCPRCSDIWGRLLIEGSYGNVAIRPCAQHGNGTISMTCQFEPWETELHESWPLGALRYELERSIQLVEKENR